MEECQTLLAAAPVRTFGKWGKKNAHAKAANGKAAASGKATAKAAKRGAAPPAASSVPPNADALNVAAVTRLAAKGAKTAANKTAPAKAAAGRSQGQNPRQRKRAPQKETLSVNAHD